MGKYNGKTFLEDISNRLKDLRGIKPNKTLLVGELRNNSFTDAKEYPYCDDLQASEIKRGDKNNGSELNVVYEVDIPHYIKYQDKKEDYWVRNYLKVYKQEDDWTTTYYVSKTLGKSFDSLYDWAGVLAYEKINFFSEKERLLLDIIIDYERGAVLCSSELYAKYQELYDGEDPQAIKEQQLVFLKRTNLDTFCNLYEKGAVFSEIGVPIFDISAEGYFLTLTIFEQNNMLSALFPDAYEYNEYIQSNGLEKVLLESLKDLRSLEDANRSVAEEIKKMLNREVKPNNYLGRRPKPNELNSREAIDQEKVLKEKAFHSLNPLYENKLSEIKIGILDKLKEVLIDKPEVFEKKFNQKYY